MYPELFEIPFFHLTVKSYGLMMVIGFLSAVFLIRRLSRNITPDPQLITNAALYSLIAGVVGARLFFIVHYFDQFQKYPLSVFAIWEGGLELLGGVILAIVVIFFYLWYHKLPIRRYLDILAIGLMSALVFGRIGCFLNGDCFGKPTNLPWAVCFPYGSHAYRSQVNPDLDRNRPDPHLELPLEFFRYVEEDRLWYPRLKPYEDLTQEQKDTVKNGPYRCLPVHPTQLYSSVNGAVLCLILYLFWRRTLKNPNSKNRKTLFHKPGCTFGLMFILYGSTRFFLEFLRDDNPFEFGWWAIYKGGTVSQNLGIYMTIFGAALMVIFAKMKLKVISLDENNKIKDSGLEFIARTRHEQRDTK
ncbi:MAG: prolipoprotein diacylglyceryl transferase [Planctomycetota bacterium]|jgi:phosphatidylglycerol:prolipoprotein diacylglycerol transferase